MLSGVSSSVPTFIVPPGVKAGVRWDQDGSTLSSLNTAYIIIILTGSNDHNVNTQIDGVLSSFFRPFHLKLAILCLFLNIKHPNINQFFVQLCSYPKMDNTSLLISDHMEQVSGQFEFNMRVLHSSEECSGV